MERGERCERCGRRVGEKGGGMPWFKKRQFFPIISSCRYSVITWNLGNWLVIKGSVKEGGQT